MPLAKDSTSAGQRNARITLGSIRVRGITLLRWQRWPLSLVMLALLSCFSSVAYAQSCEIGVQPVAFATYDPIGTTSPLLANGNVRVSCDLAFVEVSLSPGSGSYANRTLRLGGSILNYNLYTSSNFSTVWGDGSSGTGTLSRFVWFLNSPQNFPVYGRIMPGQDPSIGLHSDIITVDVRF